MLFIISPCYNIVNIEFTFVSGKLSYTSILGWFITGMYDFYLFMECKTAQYNQFLRNSYSLSTSAVSPYLNFSKKLERLRRTLSALIAICVYVRFFITVNLTLPFFYLNKQKLRNCFYFNHYTTNNLYTVVCQYWYLSFKINEMLIGFIKMWFPNLLLQSRHSRRRVSSFFSENI